MPYVSFLSDQHILDCIDKLYQVYNQSNQNMTVDKFYKNRVDPIKFNFDSKFNNIHMKDYILAEIARQHDKTISNAIGQFHENLLGGISGVTNHPVGYGIDISANNGNIIAELKNKHNTVKGEDLPSIHKKLESHVNKNNTTIGYFVHIIGKSSYDNVWNFTSKNVTYNHPRVRIISGDKFYELLTNKPNAFKELCDALPTATNDYINNLSPSAGNTGNHNGVFQSISQNAHLFGRDILTQIFHENFSKYNGF